MAPGCFVGLGLKGSFADASTWHALTFEHPEQNEFHTTKSNHKCYFKVSVPMNTKESPKQGPVVSVLRSQICSCRLLVLCFQWSTKGGPCFGE